MCDACKIMMSVSVILTNQKSQLINLIQQINISSRNRTRSNNYISLKSVQIKNSIKQKTVTSIAQLGHKRLHPTSKTQESKAH